MNGDNGPVLVPLDGSNASESAVTPALKLARAYSAPLKFAHVVEAETAAGSELRELERRFADYVGRLLTARNAGSLEHAAEVFVGVPAPTLLEEAKSARLVVMATHGRGGFHATFIGSVTDKVVRACTRPVVTIPAAGVADLADGPVLVGLDGSPAAETALAPARELALNIQRGVALVRSYALPLAAGSELAFYQPDTIDLMREGAEDYLKRVAREGEQTITTITSPSMAIEEAADALNASIVVLTRHGRGLAGRIALGSVTDRVIHALRRPVMVLPPDDAE